MESPMATLTRKSSANAHKPYANYSHVVTAQGANKLVFCAGQVAADPAGKVLPQNRSHRGGVSGDSRGHLINSTDKDLFLPGFLKLLEFTLLPGVGVWSRAGFLSQLSYACFWRAVG